jgi:flagellar basal body-associated protein FliL
MPQKKLREKRGAKAKRRVVMLEIFYIILLVVFGVLIALALTQFLMGRKTLGEELEQVQRHQSRQEKRTLSLREEFDSIALDLQILQQEKTNAEIQQACMRKLDQFNTVEDLEEP